jgi:hypothetical protein
MLISCDLFSVYVVGLLCHFSIVRLCIACVILYYPVGHVSPRVFHTDILRGVGVIRSEQIRSDQSRSALSTRRIEWQSEAYQLLTVFISQKVSVPLPN